MSEMVAMPEGWKDLLKEQMAQPYYQSLAEYLHKESQVKTIYPPKNKIFNALRTADIDQVKVVILGQDPYHQPNQANGLAFAVSEGEKFPPSLQNIFKEVKADFGACPTTPTLQGWARQGVLLLNTILTVEQSLPASHHGKGWEILTDAIIDRLARRANLVIFLLWGAKAQAKRALIGDRHPVLTAAHPSPFSVTGFYGCKHFTKVNQLLTAANLDPIDWAASA